jgi:myo-inositol-1(or 4)-monophosphatase
VDVVTEADRECEAFLRGRLAELRPDDGFFGEESDATATRSGITWVVDPIDGTVNYLYGLPNYAVSIAAVTGDPAIQPTEFELLVGVVVSPELGETYTAVAGGGAWRNGEPLQLGAGPEDLARTLVATGFSYTAARRELQAQALLNVIGKVRDLRRIGAASLDLCAVATGQIDAYYEFGLSQWDWAAGALIAKEAGASVSGLDLEQREGRSSLVAGHPRIAAQLVDLLSEVTPQDLL